MNPATSVPVVSVRYLPTTPLEFARPFGKSDDFELSRRRADSHALAARMMIRALTCRSSPVFLSTYDTPVARPFSSVVTSRAMAFVSRVSLPVLAAGKIRTFGAEKLELVMQPRLHWPQ